MGSPRIMWNPVTDETDNATDTRALIFKSSYSVSNATYEPLRPYTCNAAIRHLTSGLFDEGGSIWSWSATYPLGEKRYNAWYDTGNYMMFLRNEWQNVNCILPLTDLQPRLALRICSEVVHWQRDQWGALLSRLGLWCRNCSCSSAPILSAKPPNQRAQE